jgi:hypothetical protein
LESIILKNHKNFSGKYVAKRSFADVEVISAADTPQAVHEEAMKMGVKEPVIFYVPQEGMVHIY